MSAVEMPPAIAALPREKHGRPIPWFVHVDAETGVPDFRVIRAGGLRDAAQFSWCWICGRPRGRHAAFVIGPMCAVNRVSAEPPSHRDCAIYAAQACPFLATPAMVRRDSGLPEAAADPAGQMIRRNPGVALVWTSRTWSTFAVPGGELYEVGDPTSTSWFAHGREATRAEVLASIDSGLPLLADEAVKEGPRATQALDRMVAAAMELVPL